MTALKIKCDLRNALVIYILFITACSMISQNEAYKNDPVCRQKKSICKEYERVLKLNKGKETDNVKNLYEQCNEYTSSCAAIVQDAGATVEDRINEDSGRNRH